MFLNIDTINIKKWFIYLIELFFLCFIRKYYKMIFLSAIHCSHKDVNNLGKVDIIYRNIKIGKNSTICLYYQ